MNLRKVLIDLITTIKDSIHHYYFILLQSATSPPSVLPAGPPAQRRRWRPVLLLLGTLGLGILIGNNPFRPSSNNPDATARGYLRFKEVLSYVDRDYADSVDTYLARALGCESLRAH